MIAVDFDVDGTAYPGEPMVMYYSDGSGYPGSPPEFEIHSVEVTEAWGENWSFKRHERPDWFKLLDKIIEARLLDDSDYEYECLERLSDESW
jgi:hypothetical protein